LQCVPQRSLSNHKRALALCKRAICASVKYREAVYICKIHRVPTNEPYVAAEEPDGSAKEPHVKYIQTVYICKIHSVPAEEPYVTTAEPYVSAKEPYATTKKFLVSAKEPCIYGKYIKALYICKMHRLPAK